MYMKLTAKTLRADFEHKPYKIIISLGEILLPIEPTRCSRSRMSGIALAWYLIFYNILGIKIKWNKGRRAVCTLRNS